MPLTTTTTTTQTSTSTQVNQNLVVGTSTSSYNLGNYVSDVSIQPYMAPTLISFVANNMRPGTLLHVYFNEILVDQYCSPAILNPDPTVDSSSSDFTLQTAPFGSPIYSDINGNVIGMFNVPDATFKTGTLSLELCDTASLTLGNGAITTSAFASFTASNITVTKQSTTLTTVNPQLSVANTINVATNVTTSVSSTTQQDIVNFNTYDPVAQVFQFSTPNGEVGCYITSIDLFFFQKSLTNPNNGFLLYVCQTLNGEPDSSNILPFSSVHVPGNLINTSSDATVATHIPFESPIFINSDTPYGFVVKPDQSDPDILIFLASLGDVDITTGRQVFSQPSIGTAFEGAVTSAWTPLPSKYLKFNINRSQFTTSTATANFNETNRDHLKIINISYVNNSVSIQPGDYVYSSSNSTITTVNTSTVATANYYNTNTNILDVEVNTGSFANGTYVQVHRFANATVMTPNSSTIIASANLSSIVDTRMNVCVPQITSIEPAGTQISWFVTSTSNAYVIDTKSFPVNIDSSNELLDYERIIGSYSNRLTNFGGKKTFNIAANFVSDSSYLSPLIDTIRNNVLTVHNLIDTLTFSVYEEMFDTGTAKTKYLSLPVTLAPGQDAQNIQVTLDAYKPYSSYIKVYAKFLNSQDSDTLSAKTWTPLISDGDNYYSLYNNQTDYISLNYGVSNHYETLVIPGTVNITGNVVTGTGTNFTSSLLAGRYVNIVGDNSQQISSIISDTSMTLVSNFRTNYSNTSLLLVPPPTTAWLSSDSNTQILGTVSANTSSNIITGNGTRFLSSFVPGSIIQFANDEQVIVSIQSDIQLTVGTVWTSTVSNVNAYNTTLAGLNYLNKSNNLFVDYNQFQIKIVLFSNDSSKVPIMKNVTAIALQQ